MPIAKTPTNRRRHHFIPNYPKHPPSGTVLGFVADFQDGSGQVVTPDMVQLLNPVITGRVETLGPDDSLVIAEKGPIVFNWRGYFTFVWDQEIIFLVQKNDDPIQEVGRVVFRDNTGTGQAFIKYQNVVDNDIGDRFRFYISTTFDYASFAYSAVQIFGYKLQGGR